MSYDLNLIKPRVGESIDAAAQRVVCDEGDDEAAEPSRPSDAAETQRLVALIRSAAPSMRPFEFDYAEIAKALKCTEAEARWQYRHVELNEEPAPGFGVQATVHADRVGITVPYWHRGQKAVEAFALIRRISEPVMKAGFFLYDPQKGRPATFQKDLPEMLRDYEKIVRTMGGGAFTTKPRWWEFWKR